MLRLPLRSESATTRGGENSTGTQGTSLLANVKAETPICRPAAEMPSQHASEGDTATTALTRSGRQMPTPG